MEKLRQTLSKGGWSITFVCVIIGFMIAVQYRQVKDAKSALPNQRVEELTERLIKVQEGQDEIKSRLDAIERELETAEPVKEMSEELSWQASLTPLEGQGIILKMDDSAKIAKSGDDPNLYLIHDDDLLRVINELRAAGAEAIAINGQRLIETSEIRCAGPTLSVNNVRSSAPYEIQAIGEKKTLENAIKMRGGVAETLKIWGIQLVLETSDKVYIPPYKGTRRRVYAKVVEEK